MVGREVSELFQRDAGRPGEVRPGGPRVSAARARSRTSRSTLRAGEVLGFAGLVGARRTDVGLALFGIAPADTRRRSLLDGQPVTGPQPAGRRCGCGIAYTTEDRRAAGLVFPLSIAANISLPSLPRYLTGCGLVRRRQRSARPPRRFRERLRIRAPSVGHAGRDAVGRQPAEGRPQQVAGDATRGCSSSTSRPGASTSAPRSRSTR